MVREEDRLVETSGLAVEMLSPDGSESWCQYQYEGDWQCVPSGSVGPQTPGYVPWLFVVIVVLGVAIAGLVRRLRETSVQLTGKQARLRRTRRRLSK